MDATWSGLLDELLEAVGGLRQFFDDDRSAPLTARETKALERLFDRYLTADEALARYVDTHLRRSTRRPRR